MLEYNLLNDEGKVVVSEDSKNIFEANILLNDDVAWLDMMYFSEEKKQELNQDESFLKGSFDFLGIILNGVKRLLSEKGIEVKHVILGDFAEVKRYDLEAQKLGEEYIKEQTRVKLSSKR